jgi:hypothetical protein
MSKKELTYEFIERVFINALENVKKLTHNELSAKLRSAHEVCKKNNDMSNICFAYYDLYFTELINKKFPFRPETIEEFKKNKNIIRSHNSYAKLVAIFNDNETNKPKNSTIISLSEEPPSKKMSLLEEPPSKKMSLLEEPPSKKMSLLEEPPSKRISLLEEPPSKIMSLSEEPPKQINLEVHHQYEKEWVDWIIKNQEYVTNFNPFNFIKMIEKF